MTRIYLYKSVKFNSFCTFLHIVSNFKFKVFLAYSFDVMSHFSLCLKPLVFWFFPQYSSFEYRFVLTSFDKPGEGECHHFGFDVPNDLNELKF